MIRILAIDNPQNYQENSAVNENDIVITIHVTEKSLILIIVLVVVIFVGVIAIIMVYKKKMIIKFIKC